jgi:CelD/BcsL family acetyltransferase involved in cellulose biosynthesis
MITVTRIDALEFIDVKEWTPLVEAAPDATPFQRPEWLAPWWSEFGSGELHALAFRSGGRLVGLLPMFILEWLGQRQVTLVGNGVTDCLGLIAEPAYAAGCARLTYEHLTANRADWNVCDWRDLRSGSPLITEAPPEMEPALEPDLPCTSASLPAGELDDVLPHGLRRTIRIAKRRLERESELTFETIRYDPEAEVVRNLIRLHESRWATKGGPESLLDSPATRRFLIEATRRFSAIGKLRLYTMRYDGELVAVICGIADRGRAWGYITGMDPALSRYSPGSLVLDYAMREAMKEGATAWEFLRGDEPYKRQWGAQPIPKTRLRFRGARTRACRVETLLDARL